MISLRFLAGVVSLGFLAGCSPFASGDYLTLDAEEALEPCATVSEIPVEALDGPEPECEPVGSTLVFPDGGTLEVYAGGGGTSRFVGGGVPVRSYGHQTVGIHGIVASTWVDDCEEFESWGRPEAIAKVKEAFGEFLGQC